MRWDQTIGMFEELKAKICEKWANLTDDDLDSVGGEEDRLIGLLQQRQGLTREQAEEQLDEFLGTLEPTGQTPAPAKPLVEKPVIEKPVIEKPREKREKVESGRYGAAF